MTAIADSGPGQLIRWHYLGYAVIALGVMTVAIMSGERWFLNFVHVMCGVMWTGIDLFMGFIMGPVLRRVDLAARREVIIRLVPKTLFLMPTLAIITGTTGWYLAKDLGFLDLPWPQFGWVVAALTLVVLMTIQGPAICCRPICASASSCAGPIPIFRGSAARCVTFSSRSRCKV